MTIDITKRIEWLKKRMKMSELEEGYIKLMLQDIATEVASNTEIIGNVSDSFHKGYEEGWSDATKQATQEIHKNYRPNDR